MKPNVTFILLILMISLVHAQQHLPLKFSGDAVKWSELQWMEGSSKDDQRFQYRVPPIIVDDTIYLFNNYQGYDSNISAGFCGYSIKKLNKTTGEKYWQVQRQYREYLKRRVISQPLMQNGRLVVTLFDEAPPRLGPGTDWNRCYPAHIAIDRHTGIIVDSNYVDRSNPDLQYYEATIDRNNSKNASFYFKDSIYIFRYFEGFYRNMIDDIIDFKGNNLRRDSMHIALKYNTKQFRHYDLNNEYVYVISLRDSANYTKKEFLFNKYDHDLNLLKSVDFAESVDLPDPVKSIASFPLSSEYFVVGALSEVANPLKLELRYFMFDGNGELVDKIGFVINGDPNIEYGWYQPLVDVVNKRLLLTLSQQNARNQTTKFDIFVSDGDGLRSISQIEVEGITDHFRTTYHQMLDNGDILLFIDQFDWADQNIRWFSWMLLDGTKMGIISRTKDTELTKNKLKCYPNPTSGNVSIDLLESPATITISNMEGQKIKQLSNVSNEVNISDLPKGMYIFDIENKEIKERHKVIKIE